MKFQHAADFLELTGVRSAGDLEFAVRVHVATFRGVFHGETTCWVELTALVAFTEELRRLELQRIGSAKLESMSPGELLLEIRVVDRAGHVSAVGRVGLRGLVDGRAAEGSTIAFHIPFCPSALPDLVREFRSLATDPEA